MRVIVKEAFVGNVFAERDGTIYRIRGDCRGVIGTYSISYGRINGIGIDTRNNDLYAYGNHETLFKLDTTQSIVPSDNSLNIDVEPLLIAIDGERDSFWQVNKNSVCLKSINGDTKYCEHLPFDLEVELSSSSSSSSSLGTSSSSSSRSSWSSSSSSSSSSSGFFERYNLSVIFPSQTSPDLPPNYNCSRSVYHNSTLTIGPYSRSVRLYASTSITVDDDLVFNGSIFEPNKYIYSPYTCNPQHTFAVGKVFGTFPAGLPIVIRIKDNHGGRISGYGILAVVGV
jgi:hypothetical protein